MEKETMIDSSVNESASQTDNAAAGSASSSEGIINRALYSLSRIPAGTVLCGKYKVVSELDIVGREAALFICEYNGEKYAAKLYRRDAAIREDAAKALKSISSPYTATLCDMGIYNGLPFEITPYYAQGSLHGRTFSFDELKQRIIPILNEGLHVLHKNGIIHKNLKPSNIMLCDNEEDVVIIDFGISSIRDGSNAVIAAKPGIAPEYSAAETFRNLFLEESDYYSLGITIYELFCGHTPYSNMDPEELEQYVSAQQIPFPSNMPTELCNLIVGLTYNDITNRKNKADPNRRWTYEETANWCSGKYQQLPGEAAASAANQIPAYTFRRQKYTDMSALADALAMNWNDGKKQLFRGILSGFLRSVDPEIAGFCIDAEEAQAKGGNADLLFFRTIYKLSPAMRTFYWKGSRFESLPELGASILVHLRSDDRSNCGLYDEILSSRVISEYVTINDEKNEQLINAVRDLEERFIKHHSDEREKELAYYLTGYLLSGQRTYLLNGNVYSSVDELVRTLHSLLALSEAEFNGLCDQIIDKTGTLSAQFEAWLITLGKHEELQKWRMSEYGA